MADLSLKPGASVADVGCGAGYFTFRLRNAVGEQGKVFAVDIDPGAVKGVRDEAARQHLNNVQVILSEPADTKLQPECLDACLVCDVLHEVPPEGRLPLLQSIVRALKPGGLLFVVDYRKDREVPFDPYERLVPQGDLVKLGKDAGLSLDAEFHYLKYQVFLRFRKP
jgi:ubiquinone/menaquinone biosynthesis C-methylase UbiE